MGVERANQFDIRPELGDEVALLAGGGFVRLYLILVTNGRSLDGCHGGNDAWRLTASCRLHIAPKQTGGFQPVFPFGFGWVAMLEVVGLDC